MKEGKNKNRKKVKLGTISTLDQVKMSQEWNGNMRGHVHKNKKAYTRKRKHKNKDFY